MLPSTHHSSCFSAASGHTFGESLGEDWREVFPFPQVPAMAHRAPVYPSTRDE